MRKHNFEHPLTHGEGIKGAQMIGVRRRLQD